MHADYPLDAAAVLLVEADGTPEEVAAEMAEITAVLRGERRDRDSRVAATKRSGCCSGRAARPRFPPSAASRPTTTASTARFRARRCPPCCAASRTWSQRIRAAVRERLPRRRRQPASADPVRRQQAGRPGDAPIEFGDRILRAVHRRRRHDHRRARRRRGEDRRHVRAVPAAELERFLGDQARVRRRRRCSTRARRCRRSHAAPSSGGCTCTAASCGTPELPRF